MSEPRDLAEELAAADRYIAQAQGRVARQARIVAELTARRRDVTRDRALLHRLERSLDTVREHREAILRELQGGGSATRASPSPAVLPSENGERTSSASARDEKAPPKQG